MGEVLANLPSIVKDVFEKYPRLKKPKQGFLEKIRETFPSEFDDELQKWAVWALGHEEKMRERTSGERCISNWFVRVQKNSGYSDELRKLMRGESDA